MEKLQSLKPVNSAAGSKQPSGEKKTAQPGKEKVSPNDVQKKTPAEKKSTEKVTPEKSYKEKNAAPASDKMPSVPVKKKTKTSAQNKKSPSPKSPPPNESPVNKDIENREHGKNQISTPPGGNDLPHERTQPSPPQHEPHGKPK